MMIMQYSIFSRYHIATMIKVSCCGKVLDFDRRMWWVDQAANLLYRQRPAAAADLNQVNYVMEGGKDDNNEEEDQNDFLLDANGAADADADADAAADDDDDGVMNEEESGNRPRSKTLSLGSPHLSQNFSLVLITMI